jgi:hypothetical protein
MPALALLFHLIDSDPATESYVGYVGESAALRAINWCEYLETHAKRVYASAASPSMERAAVLLKHIKCMDVPEGASVRDIYVHGWEHLQTQEEAEDALHVLETHEWVWVERRDAGSKGGRPSTVVHLHPSLRAAANKGGGGDGDD